MIEKTKVTRNEVCVACTVNSEEITLCTTCAAELDAILAQVQADFEALQDPEHVINWEDEFPW